ncbi:MAG: ribosomal L7Ae/L30e/S12e/Gadd45 family protein [Oscillospiraceae bacterium]|nr:ribosomal L7Ae/L30e/S12e/Gadd45 family protein [Oscillospiraceae bacterium]
MKKLFGMLGLAKRAGKVSTGAFICDKMIKSGRARLVILAQDASENTKKSVRDSCRYYKIKLIEISDMATLGHATGGGDRAVVSVNDNNFAKAILDIYILCEAEKG